jgi:cyclohexyl-isocyanide hydratase
MTDRLNIGFLLFPNLTQLDLTGPYEVLKAVPDAALHLIWKTRGPIQSESGLTILADMSFADCPPLDVICVPGGPGQMDIMEDRETLDFLCSQAETARYVTSVCTGSLVLGAAGLLKGYCATSHWTVVDLLAHYGAIPVHERVVIDRNRITGGGVTAGIDFGLTLLAELQGQDAAKARMLNMEYDPAPPFAGGSPKNAAPDIVERVTAQMSARTVKRRIQAEKNAPRFHA